MRRDIAALLFLIFILMIYNIKVASYCYQAGGDHQEDAFIVVPYRDREQNLKTFLDYMHGFTKDMRIVVVEQAEGKLFNRGALSNIGINFVEGLGATGSSCVIVHDVDMLPFPGVDYHKCDKPYRLAHRTQAKRWKPLYKTYFGGVVSMNLDAWKTCNGFDNDFYGWGAEDDDLHRRCKIAGVMRDKVDPYHIQKEGRYFSTHTRKDNREKRDKTSLDRWHKNLKHDTSDSYTRHGLNDVKYQIVNQNKCGPSCTKIKVKI